jgi:hypothetical protein
LVDATRERQALFLRGFAFTTPTAVVLPVLAVLGYLNAYVATVWFVVTTVNGVIAAIIGAARAVNTSPIQFRFRVARAVVLCISVVGLIGFILATGLFAQAAGMFALLALAVIPPYVIGR